MQHEHPSSEPGKAKSLFANRWMLVAAAGVALLAGLQFWRSAGSEAPPIPEGVPVDAQGAPTPPDPAPVIGPDGRPAFPVGGGGVGPVSPAQRPEPPPLLTATGAPPTLPAHGASDGSIAIGFQIARNGKTLPGMLSLPPGGWDQGPAWAAFWAPEATPMTPPGTYGPGQSRRGRKGDKPMRTVKPAWQADAAGVGEVCLTVTGAGANPDVRLSEATLCVMDSSCSTVIGCGRLPKTPGPQG